MTAEDYYKRGNEFRKRGNWQEALNNYLEAIALDPDSPAAEAKKNGGKYTWLLLPGYVQSMNGLYIRCFSFLKINNEKHQFMSKIKGAIVVDTNRCKGCALCIEACPKDVIALTAKRVNVNGYPYAAAERPDDCIGCASCAVVCPDGCIEVYKKRMEE